MWIDLGCKDALVVKALKCNAKTTKPCEQVDKPHPGKYPVDEIDMRTPSSFWNSRPVSWGAKDREPTLTR